MPRHRTPQPSTHWTTPPPPITSENSTQHPNATWTAVDPNTSVVWYPNSMVSNIHMLENWFPIAGPPNTDHMKDIPSIPIVLDIQLDNNREIFTQWKKHRNITIDKMKPYITNTFCILHPYSLADFFTWLKILIPSNLVSYVNTMVTIRTPAT